VKKPVKQGLGLIVEISMFPYAYKLKQVSVRGRKHWDYIFVGF